MDTQSVGDEGMDMAGVGCRVRDTGAHEEKGFMRKRSGVLRVREKEDENSAGAEERQAEC